VKPPPSYELYELNNPYGQVPHIRVLPILGDHCTPLCLKIDAIWVLGRRRKPIPFQASTKPRRHLFPSKIRDVDFTVSAPAQCDQF
jgi:hypothetical protein